MRHRHRFHGIPLQRRLFVTFAVTIVATAALVLAAMHLVNPDPAWKREYTRVLAFVGNRFADVWDDPSARGRVAQGFEKDLDVDVELQAADGRVLYGGVSGCRAPAVVAPVERGGVRLGAARVCLERHHQGSWHAVVPIGLAVVVLWIASGITARRLARPLRVVTAAAGEIGKGKLATRVQLGSHAWPEARVLAEVINEMAQRIERQLSDQRALLAAVSHEIRTPLARMRLLTELGREKADTAETFEELDKEVMQVDELVSDLLASSRLDFSAMTRKVLEPAKVGARALERAGEDVSKLQAPAATWELEADPTLLARALANLIDNARKHGGGVDALVVAERNGRTVFEVHDRGPGFEPGEENKAFEAFYHRAKSAEAEARSTGLGLALVRRIAEAHGGSAFARNREGGGAIVGIAI